MYKHINLDFWYVFLFKYAVALSINTSSLCNQFNVILHNYSFYSWKPNYRSKLTQYEFATIKLLQKVLIWYSRQFSQKLQTQWCFLYNEFKKLHPFLRFWIKSCDYFTKTKLLPQYFCDAEKGKKNKIAIILL